MASFATVLLALFCISSVLSDPNGVIVPCKRSDMECMIRSANIAIPLIGAGIPSLGVTGFAPARVPEIHGEASNYIFNFTRNEITGYKDCVISELKFSLDSWTVKFDLTCPKMLLTGDLVVSGELLGVPVEGDGEYKMFVGNYLIKVDANIEKVEGKDGHQHLAFTTFKHQGIPLEPFRFDYNVKSKKQLSPKEAAAFETNKYMKSIELITETYIGILYKQSLFKTVNEFLATVPFEDLFVD